MADHAHSAPGAGETRRDFLYLMATSAAVFGAATVAWPFINSMNPSGDVLALSSIEVDLSPIQLGQRVTVKWRSQPVFIDHRTPDEIQKAQSVNVAELRDPQTDASRVQKAEWLVMVGICTHLGCIPLFYPNASATTPVAGWLGGYFCPCHGSKYDPAGRVFSGVPAPYNLPVPPYRFVNDKTLRIGENDASAAAWNFDSIRQL
jgi:ubiquinol-cytochrome c reductase iron-sulfur subunit